MQNHFHFFDTFSPFSTQAMTFFFAFLTKLFFYVSFCQFTTFGGKNRQDPQQLRPGDSEKWRRFGNISPDLHIAVYSQFKSIYYHDLQLSALDLCSFFISSKMYLHLTNSKTHHFFFHFYILLLLIMYYIFPIITLYFIYHNLV